MLDLHPEPRHSRVEVHSGFRISDVGRLDESEFLPDIDAAEKVLAAAIAAKRFALEAEKRFDFLYHFTTVDEYKAFLIDEEWGAARAGGRVPGPQAPGGRGERAGHAGAGLGRPPETPLTGPGG